MLGHLSLKFCSTRNRFGAGVKKRFHKEVNGSVDWVRYFWLGAPHFICYFHGMQIERVKYIIWAADMGRAVAFYRDLFGGEVLKQSDVISEVVIGGAVIGIHGGGEGKRTWTGLSFQVPDVVAGAGEVVAAGGQLTREPQPEADEPPHLAMCMDPEGNEFMLTRKR